MKEGIYMGDKSNKQHNSAEEEPVFYDASAGVTKAEAIKMIQGLHFSPDQSPMGVAGDRHGYGIMSYPGFVLMFCNQDSEHPMQIFKREFMPLEGILQDVGFYAVQEDYESAAACVIEGLEQNRNADEHWELYCTAGEVFWRLREMELAGDMFLQAYQCSDCDQKAHVLCQAAATYCIRQEPNTGFALYHKALQEEPESLEVRHDLGGFHWDMGELDKAAEYYFSVLEKDASYYASYEELSNLFGQLGNSVWQKRFMDCFAQSSSLPQAELEAAKADMQGLLAKA